MLLVVCVGAEYSRVVVTFKSAAFNTLEAVELIPEDVTLVKQYGRRMVLHLGNESSSPLEDALWIAGIWGGDDVVERVEPDWFVGVDSNQTGESLEAAAASAEIPWHLDPLEPYGMHLNPLLAKQNTSTVALLDSGLSAAGTALWRPVGGYCFISSPEYSNTGLGRNPDYTDPGDQGPTCSTSSWHGTKVASIVKAVAPNSKLSILRVLGRCGSGFASDVTDAIVWAAGGGINGVKVNPYPAKVVSMSLAGKGLCPTYLQSAVNQAVTLGATIIAAAGNAGANATLYFPGNCKGVLSIGASTRQGSLASYSNWGETLDFSAPGGDGANPVQVMTVGLDAQLITTTVMGTSFAAPHVAGVVLLLQSANVSLEKGGLYVPCTGECGEKGILNGVSVNDDGPNNLLTAFMLAHQVTSSSNDSTVTMAGETCPHGYDATKGADRYGCQRSYDTYCGAGEFIASYVICVRGSTVDFSTFGCMDQNGVLKSIKNIGNTLSTTCSVYSESASSSDGFIKYAQSLQSAAIAQKYNWVMFPSWPPELWYINLGTKASVQSCQNDERIIGFHGWYGASLDESCIYCRKTCNCAPGQYNNNGLCTACDPGKYSVAGAYSCTVCDSCAAGKYETGACTATQNRQCSDCSACGAGTYQTTACTPSNNRQCTGCSSCSAGSSFETSACTPTSNRGCTPCSGCAAGSYETSACTTTSNRGCTVCRAVCAADTYETTACTSTSNRVCSLCQSCLPDNYRQGCGGNSAGSCTACGACSAGYYRSGCTGASAGTCSVCGTCSAGYYRVGCTWTSAGECRGCEAGWYCAGGSAGRVVCPKGSYCPSTSSQPTNCLKGTYSASESATAQSTCLSCNAGYFSGADGATVCTICNTGSMSLAGASYCTSCMPSVQYQDATGQSSCKLCAHQNCPPGKTEQSCSIHANYLCTSCASIANCVYSSTTCDINGVPTCSCDKGLEKIKISATEYGCVPCAQGKYKHSPGLENCILWDKLSCEPTQYVALGTRFDTSVCLNYPKAPDNGYADGQTWTCNKGFEK